MMNNDENGKHRMNETVIYRIARLKNCAEKFFKRENGENVCDDVMAFYRQQAIRLSTIRIPYIPFTNI